MISERTFATSFGSFWAELLPLLTPSFVHMISEVHKEHLSDEFGLTLLPIERRASADSAVIAEFAFYLAKSATDKGMTIKAAYDDASLRNDARVTAATTVQQSSSVTFPHNCGNPHCCEYSATIRSRICFGFNPCF